MTICKDKELKYKLVSSVRHPGMMVKETSGKKNEENFRERKREVFLSVVLLLHHTHTIAILRSVITTVTNILPKQI